MNSDTDKLGEKFDFLRLTGFGRKKSTRDKKYATLNRRMMAATIDSFVLLLLAPAFDRIVPINAASLQKYSIDASDPTAARRYLVQVLTDHDFVTSWVNNLTAQVMVICFLSAICWHYWAATPGKMIMRIKVVDAKTEAPINDQQIFLRVFGYLLSGMVFLLGFFWIGIDKRRQGWHDKLAGTTVIVQPWHREKGEIV